LGTSSSIPGELNRQVFSFPLALHIFGKVAGGLVLLYQHSVMHGSGQNLAGHALKNN
jgi:hypothetical protein